METFQVVQVVLLTLGVLVVLKAVVLLALSGGKFDRISLATKVFFRVLRDGGIQDKAKGLLAPPEPPKPPRLSAEPVRLLAFLQREARLLDFLMEDVSGAGDEQLGAGVREVHRKAQQVLNERLQLEPVMARNEGETVEVPSGFDPSAIQVTGNVTGSPPFRGTLEHRGWRVKGYNLPPAPPGQDDLVLAPAQVEVA